MQNNDFVPTILDVEASGFGSHSYPVEVGLVDEQGQRYCQLIKPLEHWDHWSDEAESLHGISRDMLRKRGAPVFEVCRALNERLAGKTVYSDGWVVDYPWMITLFEGAAMRMNFKISPLENILSEAQMIRWHAAQTVLRTKLSGKRHRASTDAELIQQVFLHTRNEALSDNANSAAS